MQINNVTNCADMTTKPAAQTELSLKLEDGSTGANGVLPFPVWNESGAWQARPRMEKAK